MAMTYDQTQLKALSKMLFTITQLQRLGLNDMNEDLIDLQNRNSTAASETCSHQYPQNTKIEE